MEDSGGGKFSCGLRLVAIEHVMRGCGRKFSPAFAGGSPIEQFVVKPALMRRAAEIIMRRQSNAFHADWKILQHVLLRLEAVEETPFELLFGIGQRARVRFRSRSGKELTGCHYPRAVKLTRGIENHRRLDVFAP